MMGERSPTNASFDSTPRPPHHRHSSSVSSLGSGFGSDFDLGAIGGRLDDALTLAEGAYWDGRFSPQKEGENASPDPPSQARRHRQTWSADYDANTAHLQQTTRQTAAAQPIAERPLRQRLGAGSVIAAVTSPEIRALNLPVTTPFHRRYGDDSVRALAASPSPSSSSDGGSDCSGDRAETSALRQPPGGAADEIDLSPVLTAAAADGGGGGGGGGGRSKCLSFPSPVSPHGSTFMESILEDGLSDGGNRRGSGGGRPGEYCKGRGKAASEAEVVSVSANEFEAVVDAAVEVEASVARPRRPRRQRARDRAGRNGAENGTKKEKEKKPRGGRTTEAMTEIVIPAVLEEMRREREGADRAAAAAERTATTKAAAEEIQAATKKRALKKVKNKNTAKIAKGRRSFGSSLANGQRRLVLQNGIDGTTTASPLKDRPLDQSQFSRRGKTLKSRGALEKNPPSCAHERFATGESLSRRDGPIKGNVFR